MTKFTMTDIAAVAAEFTKHVEVERDEPTLPAFNYMHLKIGKRSFVIYQNTSSFVIAESKGRRRVKLEDLFTKRFTTLAAFRKILASL